MTTRVGINGFGRIGRQSLKAILERHPHELIPERREHLEVVPDLLVRLPRAGQAPPRLVRPPEVGLDHAEPHLRVRRPRRVGSQRCVVGQRLLEAPDHGKP